MQSRPRLWHAVTLNSVLFTTVLLVTVLLAAALGATGCAEEPVITSGTIIFDPQPASTADTMLYITIVQDPSGKAEELQRVEQEVTGDVNKIKYKLRGEEPPAGSYIMRVHLDLDDNEEINTGDYVSDDVPVFRGTYPETVDAVLTPVE